MQYVEDTGTVVAVDADKATVKLDHKRSDDCKSCCTCSAFGSDQFTIQVERGDLQEGQRVRARIPRVNEYLSMLLVFVLPMVLFIAGIFVGRTFESDDQIGSAAVLGGIVGLVVAFTFAWMVNRAVMKKAMPEVRPLASEDDEKV